LKMLALLLRFKFNKMFTVRKVVVTEVTRKGSNYLRIC